MKHLATRRKCWSAKSRLKVRCHSAEISLKARESLFLNLCVNILCTLFFSQRCCMLFFYVHVTVHRNKFLCNKTN